ncbi:Uncharacterised protein [Chlamydia trachomatis]|nr:Uncharacterised protein [Chlamydia trachomatis]
MCLELRESLAEAVHAPRANHVREYLPKRANARANADGTPFPPCGIQRFAPARSNPAMVHMLLEHLQPQQANVALFANLQ